MLSYCFENGKKRMNKDEFRIFMYVTFYFFLLYTPMNPWGKVSSIWRLVNEKRKYM